MTKGLIIFFIILVLIFIGVFVITDKQVKEVTEKECHGEVVLTGYLVNNCPWQVYPSLSDYKLITDRKCNLDIWLSQHRPQTDPPSVCTYQDESDLPLTSTCFFKKINPLELWDKKLSGYPYLSLIGDYQPMQVCYLDRKNCADQNCAICQQCQVFVPCKVVK